MSKKTSELTDLKRRIKWLERRVSLLEEAVARLVSENMVLKIERRASQNE